MPLVAENLPLRRALVNGGRSDSPRTKKHVGNTEQRQVDTKTVAHQN